MIAQIDAELPITVAVWGGSILAFLFLILAFVKVFLVIGRPNELLVFSGRQHATDDGHDVGWRYIAGGRSFRWPIIERVDRMDLTTMQIDIKIRGAYAKGNIPVNVDAIANAKLTLVEPFLHHAIERFLGRSQEEIRLVAKDTLEGTLRDVLAGLTPEEINHDRQRLSEDLRKGVQEDLGKLGLQVDTFKIQHVTDEVNYLDSVSRVKIAEVIRDAEIAESDADREAEQAIAGARSRGHVAVEQAKAIVARKENELKRIRAELEAKAKSEEERTVAAAREARATAEQQLQEIRKELERLRLEAEEVIPAQRRSDAQALRAAGDAAIKSETGRAQADALGSLYKAWGAAGDRATELFLIQQIDALLQQVADVTEGLTIDRVNLIDSGDGRTLSRYVASFPAVVTQLLESVRETVGIDVASILTSSDAGPKLTAPAPNPAPTSKKKKGGA